MVKRTLQRIMMVGASISALIPIVTLSYGATFA